MIVAVVARSDVVLVESNKYLGTGVLVRGNDGEVILVTTLHTFVEVKPEPLTFPARFTCWYSSLNGETWSEDVAWLPLNSAPNLLEDWVAFRVYNSRETKTWRLASALERQIDGRRCEWDCYGFPHGFSSGLAATGTVTGVGGRTSAYPGTNLVGEEPVIQLFVSQMQGDQVPAPGFSGAPIAVGDRIVGIFRSFPPRSPKDNGALLAQNATVYSIPIERIAERLGWHPVQPWGYADEAAQRQLELPAPPELRHKHQRLHKAPSQLLRADNQALKFDSEGVRSSLEQLENLVRGPNHYQVIAAPGGSGKTRLLIEFCHQMQQRGWIAGFVPTGHPSTNSEMIEGICAGRVPRLLVFDYAETAPLLAAKAVAIAAKRPEPPIHVVMLSRDMLNDEGPLWWARFVHVSGVPEHDDAWIELPKLYSDAKARERAFVQAVTTFYGEVGELPAALDDDLFTRPLYLHALALLYAQYGLPDPDNLSESGLLKEVLRHERAGWTHWHASNTSASMPTGFHRAVGACLTIATLFGTCESSFSRRLASLVLDEIDHSELNDALRCIRDIYGDGDLRPLEPDLLGELLVYEMLQLGSVETWLALVSDPRRTQIQLARALTVLTRVSKQRVQAQEWLRQLLRQSGPALVHHIVAASSAEDDQKLHDAKDPIAPGLALANAARMVLDQQLALELDGAIPRATTELTELSALTLEFRVAEFRKIGNNQERLALALSNLAVRLRNLGKRDDALRAAREAEFIYREISTTERAVKFSGLSTVMITLANCLGASGKHDEALGVLDTLIQFHRTVAENHGRGHIRDMATTLGNLCVQMAALGRYDKALAMVEEAVSIYRDMPDSTEDLVWLLNSQAATLGLRGERDRALDILREVISICRPLVDQKPDTFRPSLALALSNVSSLLLGLGKSEEGLVAVDEALQIYRSLWKRSPDRFLPDFMRAIFGRSQCLSEMGTDRQQALDVSEDAVRLCREAVGAIPDVYRTNLASALYNYGCRLRDMGRNRDALAASREAVILRRELILLNPALHTHNLARELNALGIALSQVGQLEKAVVIAGESEALYRALVMKGDVDVAVKVEFANTLSNYGLRLGHVNRVSEALRACAEASQLLRELTKDNPGRFESNYADTLQNYSGQLCKSGNAQEALRLMREAVRMRRDLYVLPGDSGLPELASALYSLAIIVDSIGEEEDALIEIGNAVALYRNLAARQAIAFRPSLARALLAQGKVQRKTDASRAVQPLVEGLLTLDLPYFHSNLEQVGPLIGQLSEELSGVCYDADVPIPSGVAPLVQVVMNTRASRRPTNT